MHVDFKSTLSIDPVTPLRGGETKKKRQHLFINSEHDTAANEIPQDQQIISHERFVYNLNRRIPQNERLREKDE